MAISSLPDASDLRATAVDHLRSPPFGRVASQSMSQLGDCLRQTPETQQARGCYECFQPGDCQNYQETRTHQPTPSYKLSRLRVAATARTIPASYVPNVARTKFQKKRWSAVAPSVRGVSSLAVSRLPARQSEYTSNGLVPPKPRWCA
jgi:hypothetical protein